MSQIYDNDDGVPSYVKELINKIADREGFTNYSITNSAGSNLGDGFMGDLLRFKINGKRNNVVSSLSLICKMPSPNLLRREQFNTDVTFAREIYLYEYLLPYFIEFQKEHGISEADGFYSFPKCYGTVFDEKRNGDHVIVMEDLIASNYYLWDKLKKIDYDHVKLVMEELGKFHAVSFAIRDKNPEKLNEIKSKCVNTFHTLMYTSPMAIEFYNTNITKAIDALEPHETNLIEKLEAIKGSHCQEIVKQVFSNTTPEPFGVLVHGDVWNNNIMYQRSDNGKPSKLSMIDWQLSQFGSPALDVAHYFFCSLDEDIRSKYYDEFIELYYNSFAQSLEKFGSDYQKLFTIQDLMDQFRKYGRTCLLAGPILCQMMTCPSEDTPDLDEFVQQYQEAQENGEGYVDAFGDVHDGYKTRMSCLLRDCVKEGIL